MNIVVTTIQPPTQAMQMLADGLSASRGTLWVFGDRKGPTSFDLPNTQFFSIDDQYQLGFSLAKLLPEKHYTRKNLGYLSAIRAGAKSIVETDDDNLPRPEFFATRETRVTGRLVSGQGWCNVYNAFTDSHIWPRGLPLEKIHEAVPQLQNISTERESLIQQSLADENPDVDAAYRLILPLPLDFRKDAPVILSSNQWCPFNSQNTTFFNEAFPLLYLPSFCSFRMTDIWRSFVAQRCLWEMDSFLSFHSPTVWQERNEHNLLRDFEDEVPGYLNNDKIREVLESLTLKKGRQFSVVCENLLVCYRHLCEAKIVGSGEIPLLEAWINDLDVLVA